MILDLFAGPGGWDTGLRAAGYDGDLQGVEWDADACDTARAAGHERTQADVSALNPRDLGPVTGLIASPPCQGFSAAGKGRGRDDAVHLLRSLNAVRTETELVAATRWLGQTMTDPRSLFALEPLRYSLALTPSWTTWEQVPAVLPIWEAAATILRRIGYSVVTGTLQAEQYGVPQTRKRAILVAHAPWMPPAQLPTPTHSAYYSRTPNKLDPGVNRWVSMADALGWPVRDLVGFPRRADRGESVTINGVDYRARDLRPAGRPAQAVTEKARSWQRLPRALAPAGTTSMAVDPRPIEYPAPTITGKGTAEWGQRLERAAGRKDRDPLGVRVEIEEAAVLQSFPSDYPWQGSRTAQYRQVGDAVPPQLAKSILVPVLAAEHAARKARAA